MATNNAINRENPFPTFLAIISADILNAVGDGSVFKIPGDVSVFDETSSYNIGTYEFTAPVDGKYFLQATVELHLVGAAHTTGYISIVTSNRTYTSSYVSPTAIANSVPDTCLSFGVIADMDASDIAYVNVCVSGGAKTITIKQISSSDLRTWFCGFLIH